MSVNLVSLSLEERELLTSIHNLLNNAKNPSVFIQSVEKDFLLKIRKLKPNYDTHPILRIEAGKLLFNYYKYLDLELLNRKQNNKLDLHQYRNIFYQKLKDMAFAYD